MATCLGRVRCIDGSCVALDAQCTMGRACCIDCIVRIEFNPLFTIQLFVRHSFSFRHERGVITHETVTLAFCFASGSISSHPLVLIILTAESDNGARGVILLFRADQTSCPQKRRQ